MSKVGVVDYDKCVYQLQIFFWSLFFNSLGPYFKIFYEFRLNKTKIFLFNVYVRKQRNNLKTDIFKQFLY